MWNFISWSKLIWKFYYFLDDIDEDKLDEYIRILEQDLENVQLKNFDLPKNEEEASTFEFYYYYE